ncbi:FliO/MopB family protein [Succinivibrio sp.]|uniref:FliO/MopB family protein n=1 Tax=Succinivibrio sp. TaxID=2053619 RepID=UPI00386BED80
MGKIISIVLMLLSSSVYADETATNRGLVSSANIVSWITSTFVILFIIMILAYLLKKTRFGRVNTGELRIENQLFLGPKQKIMVVNAYGRKVLLGVTVNQINYLTDLDANKSDFETLLKGSALQNDKPQESSDDTK